MKKIKSVSWFDDRFYRIERGDEAKYFPSVTTVLGVTSKPFLMQWVGDIGTREANLRKNEAAESGTRVHHACQSIMDGGLAIFNPRYRPEYTSEQISELREKHDYRLHVIDNQEDWIRIWRFVQWVKVVNPIYIASEVIVYDEKNEVAGSLDYLFYIAPGKYMVNGAKPIELGGFTVVDLKSGKILDDDQDIQISKYSSMLNGLVKSRDLTFDNVKMPELKNMQVTSACILHVQAQTKGGIQGVSTKIVGSEAIQSNTAYFDNNLLPVWRRRNANKQPKVFDMPIELSMEVNNG